MRSLSPKGNIYFCRDLAVSEEHLSKLDQRNLIYSSNIPKPFNISDLQLDKNSNDFLSQAYEYDKLTSCPVKSFEFQHLVGDTPPWIKDSNFQDIVIYPIFELMDLTFDLYVKNYIHDSKYIENYIEKVNTYGYILNQYEKYI